MNCNPNSTVQKQICLKNREKRLAQTEFNSEQIDEAKENKKIVQTFAAAGLGSFLYDLITMLVSPLKEVASEKVQKSWK